MASGEKKSHLSEVAWLFLRMGLTSFGGPGAHIAMMEREIVQRRRWLSREDFLDYVGASNLIPGPNSTEVAIHLGFVRAGWMGLLVAGFCFIVPAALVTMAVAWAYVTYGALPRAQAILYGIKPVIIALVVHALWVLARTALKDSILTFVAAAAAFACYVGHYELAVLVAGGVLSMAARRGSPLGTTGAVAFAFLPLFLFFLKVGAVLYGGGYVLLAFLQGTLVERYGWLTQTQLLDAVAAGQITPGPIFTTATFIGYQLGGIPGATLATLGIFLPAFAFVALSGPLIPRIRASPQARAFLDGVNAAAVALMAAVGVSLARAALVDAFTLTLFGATTLLLFARRVNSAWLVIGGAVIGWLARG